MEGIDSDWNGQNGPKCTVGRTKAHKKAHGFRPKCDWAGLGEIALERAHGPSLVLIQSIEKANRHIAIKTRPIWIVEYTLPSLTLPSNSLYRSPPPMIYFQCPPFRDLCTNTIHLRLNYIKYLQTMPFVTKILLYFQTFQNYL